MTDNLLLHIIEQTNLYAEEVFLSKNTTEKSRITTWKPLDLPEFFLDCVSYEKYKAQSFARLLENRRPI